jgi:hypothetical protein
MQITAPHGPIHPFSRLVKREQPTNLSSTELVGMDSSATERGTERAIEREREGKKERGGGTERERDRQRERERRE